MLRSLDYSSYDPCDLLHLCPGPSGKRLSQTFPRRPVCSCSLVFSVYGKRATSLKEAFKPKHLNVLVEVAFVSRSVGGFPKIWGTFPTLNPKP